MKKNSQKKTTKIKTSKETNKKSKIQKGSNSVNTKILLPIMLLVMAIFCILLYIFVNKKNEKAIDEVSESINETINETINVEESSSQVIPIYQIIPSGTYFDNISKRATMNVSFGDDIYYFEVNWANSAFENIKWEFSGKYDKIENTIIYSNSNCTYEVYDDDGNVEQSVIFENGEGKMKYEDKKLCWLDYNTDKADDQEFNGIFELPNDIE